MKKAFTILEILVVLSVIAVLVGIAVPKFKGMQDESKVTQVKRELKTLQAAVESYSMNANPKTYPPTSSTVSASSLISAVPQIISRVLYDPFGAAADSEYNYTLSNNGRYYTLCSAGPDRTGATETVGDDGEVAVVGDDLCVTNGTITVGGGSGGGAAGLGEYCSYPGQCQSGYCDNINAVCTDGSNGSGCGLGTDCQSGYCGYNYTNWVAICTDGADGSGCNDSSDCQSGYCDSRVCGDGSNGSGCQIGVDCQSGYCNLGFCGDGANGSLCANAAACQSGHCLWGECVAGLEGAICSFSEHCESGYCINNVCSPQAGANGDFCNDGTSCGSGICQGNTCSECASMANCQNGYYCVNRTCSAEKGSSGDRCSDLESCGNGSVCIMNVGMCSDGAIDSWCYYASDCESNHCALQKCSNGVTGVDWCDVGADCESGYCNRHIARCSDGSLGSGCAYLENCANGYCNNFVCSAEKGPIGAGCARADSCQSGYCSIMAGWKCTDGLTGADCLVGAWSCQSGNCVDGHCT